MENDFWHDSQDVDEAKEYVFQHETLYLISEMEENAKLRILYLIKEYPIEQQIKKGSYVVDLALLNDSAEFAIKVLNLMANTVKHFLDATYDSKREQESAREQISTYNKNCEKILDYAISTGNTDLANKLQSMFVQDALKEEDDD